MDITNDALLDIIADASYRLHSEIKKAYKLGNLSGFLASIGMSDLMPEEEKPLYDTDPEGKIIIFGASQIRDKDIFGCLKEFGIMRDRVELYLGYDEAKKYDYNKLQYNPNFRLILFGPVPHSGEGKEDASSVITNLEQGDGYPKVIRLTDGHGLKITKTSLKRAIGEQVLSGYLAV